MNKYKLTMMMLLSYKFDTNRNYYIHNLTKFFWKRFRIRGVLVDYAVKSNHPVINFCCQNGNKSLFEPKILLKIQITCALLYSFLQMYMVHAHAHDIMLVKCWYNFREWYMIFSHTTENTTCNFHSSRLAFNRNNLKSFQKHRMQYNAQKENLCCILCDIRLIYYNWYGRSWFNISNF